MTATTLDICDQVDMQLSHYLKVTSPKTQEMLAGAKAIVCDILEGLSPVAMEPTQTGLKLAYGPSIDPEKTLVVLATPKRAIHAEFAGWPDITVPHIEELPDGAKMGFAANLLDDGGQDGAALAVALSRCGAETFKDFERRRRLAHAQGSSLVLVFLAAHTKKGFGGGLFCAVPNQR